MSEPQVRESTHLILVVGPEGQDSKMFWGHVSEKMVGDVASPNKFRIVLYSRPRPGIPIRTEVYWTPKLSDSMPMPLSSEDAPAWEVGGRALQTPRSAGSGAWSIDVRRFPPDK